MERRLLPPVERLRRDVYSLAQDIGERNWQHPEALERAARFIEDRWHSDGYSPRRQVYEAMGRQYANIELELPGTTRPQEIVVLGAHYDTAAGSPGGNDNGSAVASLLSIARRFRPERFARTLRLVAFTNEEPPFTRKPSMGSRVNARRARAAGDCITGMVCLETIGCRRPEPGSQRLSLGGLLLPRRGDFIALAANWRSRRLLATAAPAFRLACTVPCRALVTPGHLPGAWSSDHWSFWKEGYPALLVTDTAPLRYRWYHTPEDTAEKVDFDFLAEVVDGVEGMMRRLLQPAR